MWMVRVLGLGTDYRNHSGNACGDSGVVVSMLMEPEVCRARPG